MTTAEPVKIGIRAGFAMCPVLSTPKCIAKPEVNKNSKRKFIFLSSNMASGYPSVRPGQEGSHAIELPKGIYGVPDMMLYGFQNARRQNVRSHPLEHSEAHWNENKLKMDYSMLRNMQGLHAPLKLQMEFNTARQMQRLPGLPSSRLMENTLSGRNELIDFDDIFNVPEESEAMVQPHILIEKRQHIL